jgi:hypothetical protein
LSGCYGWQDHLETFPALLLRAGEIAGVALTVSDKVSRIVLGTGWSM